MKYFEECISEAFDEANIIATQEQIKSVAECVEGAFDNHSQAHGYDCIPDPRDLEIKELEKKLKIEKDKVICDKCRDGTITINGPVHSYISSCTYCNGEGRRTL